MKEKQSNGKFMALALSDYIMDTIDDRTYSDELSLRERRSLRILADNLENLVPLRACLTNDQ